MGLVLRRHNTQHLLLGSNAAPEFSLRRPPHSPLLTVLGEPHGRNLASALMRSRVHNRTSDRGGKPIWLAWPWALPPVLRRAGGRSLQKGTSPDHDVWRANRCRSLPISTEGRLILGLRGSRATRLKWLSRPFAFQIHRIMSLRSLPGEFSRSQGMAKATQITSATKRWRASGFASTTQPQETAPSVCDG